jgi:hypothetical protein
VIAGARASAKYWMSSRSSFVVISLSLHLIERVGEGGLEP